MAFTKQRRNAYGNRGANGNTPPVQGNTALDPQSQQWNSNQQNNFRQNPNPQPQAAQPSQQPADFGTRSQAPAPQSRPNPRQRETSHQPSAQPHQRQGQAAYGQSNQGQYRQPQQQYQQPPQGQQPQYRQAQGRQAPQTQQQNANTPPAQDFGMPAPAPESESTLFISTKIWKVNGKDKVVDFSSKLTKAYEQDFANVHGIGGSDHAPNSTICVTICDFTKGTGENSTTVKYAVDVEDMAMLYHTAMAARMGLLNILPRLDMGSNSNCVFAYNKQKNNPYQVTRMNGVDYAPVSQIGIYYDPSRNYPWIIQITNCEAPIKQKSNGANTHNSSQAINVQEAFIYLSADDFCAAMVAVERFVRLWEQRMFRTVDAGCRKYEQAIEGLKNKKNNAG